MLIDLIIIIVLCIYSVWGLKRGILKSLASFFTLILSLYLTYKLLPVISSQLNNVINYENFNFNIFNSERIVDFVNKNAKLSNFIKLFLHTNSNSQKISLSKLLVDSIIFILTNTLIRIIIKFLLDKMIKFSEQSHPTNILDKISGILIGFAKGIFISCVLCYLTLFANESIIKNQVLNNQIESSSLIQVFSQTTEYVIQTINNNFNN